MPKALHMFRSDMLKSRKQNQVLAVVSYFTFNLKRGVKEQCGEAVFSQSATQPIQESGKWVRI